MIEISNVQVTGWEHAIRGMRNPKNSWDRSDTDYGLHDYVNVGVADHKLMMTLQKGGPVHRKYLRMVTVYLDINAPLYWWKEFDTYKVGTVANSCSTMHKIHAKRFERDDFSIEHLHNFREQHWMVCMDNVIASLNVARDKFLETGENLKRTDLTDAERKHVVAQQKEFWWQMIQLLPSSYNQKRTIMLNYEVLANMYKWRKDHKLDEWREFCKWIKKLPYNELITGEWGD